jgi:hypothetical protein
LSTSPLALCSFGRRAMKVPHTCQIHNFVARDLLLLLSCAACHAFGPPTPIFGLRCLRQAGLSYLFPVSLLPTPVLLSASGVP